MGFGVVVSIKYSKLKQENADLKIEYTTILNPIKTENKLLTEEVLLLKDEIKYYESKIDSLNKIKQKVIIQYEYVESKTFSEGVLLLQKNLKCEND